MQGNVNMIQEKIDKLKEEIKRLKDTVCNGQLHFNEVTRRFQIAEATLKAHEEDKAEFLDILDKEIDNYNFFDSIKGKDLLEIDYDEEEVIDIIKEELKNRIKQSLIGKEEK